MSDKPVIDRKRIRLKINADKDANVQDVLAGSTPKLAKGNDVQFELGIFFNEAVADLQYISTITINVKDSSDLDGAALMTKTITDADIDNTLTATQWTEATNQHALVAFSASETNFTAGTYHLAIACVTNHTPGREVTLGKSTLEIWDDGIGSAEDAVEHPATYYNRDETDARYMQRHADGASIAFKNGQHPYCYNPDDGLWYPLGVRTVDGQVVLAPGQIGESL